MLTPTWQRLSLAAVVALVAVAAFAAAPRGADARGWPVEMTVDRGNDALYRDGDPISVCIYLRFNVPSPTPGAPFAVRVTGSVDGYPSAMFYETAVPAVGHECFASVVRGPFGAETLRADVFDPGTRRLVASTLAYYRSEPHRDPAMDLTVTVDRGDGATYNLGEMITICVWTSRPAIVQLSYFVNDVAITTRGLGTLAGWSCGEARVAWPIGWETVRAEAIDAGRVIARAEVHFRSVNLAERAVG